jgi:hypothetical protein
MPNEVRGALIQAEVLENGAHRRAPQVETLKHSAARVSAQASKPSKQPRSQARTWAQRVACLPGALVRFVIVLHEDEKAARAAPSHANACVSTARMLMR